MRGLSFRVKMSLAFAASALGAIFLLFAAGSYYVNQLQKSNVREALKLAREQACKISELAKEFVSAVHNSTPENAEAAKSKLHQNLKLWLRDSKGIVVATIFDIDGKVIISETNGTADTVKGVAIGKEPYSTKLPDQGSGQLELTAVSGDDDTAAVNEPMRNSEGKNIGIVNIEVVKSPTFLHIEATSHQITTALVGGCGLLFGFLLLVFLTLWRLFAKQVDLLQSNARLDRMAYVGTLASGLAHEIRNPLSAMNVNLEVMREELSDATGDSPTQALDIASRVQREVLQLNSTLTSFLDFALPSKEGYTDFSLRSLLKELLDAHSEQMRQAEITWELADGPAGGAVIAADRRSLHQAFRNILLNAIQILGNSLKKGIRVRIEQLPNARLRTTISDTGPGINPENMSRIFDVFFSTRKGGSGFGLAITRKIIEEHGGTIRAVNNEGALGTSFIVELPRDGSK